MDIADIEWAVGPRLRCFPTAEKAAAALEQALIDHGLPREGPVMNIVHPGKLPEDKPTVWRGACRRCGCVFTMDEAEVKALDWKDRNAPCVRCPTAGCLEEVFLSPRASWEST